MQEGALGCTHIFVSIITSHIRNHTYYELEKADGDGVDWHFKHVVLH